MAKLPVGHAFTSAYAFAFRNFGPLLRTAAVPMTLSFVIAAANFWFGVLVFGSDFVEGIIQILLHVVFAVSWARFILLGERVA